MPGVTIGGMGFSFVCRKCGRHRKAQFDVPYPVTKAYAAKRVFMKNTRWGPQCVPSCQDAAIIDLSLSRAAAEYQV